MIKVGNILQYLKKKIYLPTEFCCFSLESGAKFMGWIEVIVNPILLSFYLFLFSHTEHIEEIGDDKFMILAIFTIPTSIIDFLAAMWFLCGIFSVSSSQNFTLIDSLNLVKFSEKSQET
jgi:hypothetical protein